MNDAQAKEEDAPNVNNLPTTRRPRQRTPAHDAWRRELARGERTATTFDPLWRAACAEASAVEAEALGQHDAAERDRQRARAILDDALAEEGVA